MAPHSGAGGATPRPRKLSAGGPDDRLTDAEGGQDDQGAQGVGQHVPGEDAPADVTQGERGLHVAGAAHAQHLGADHPGVAGGGGEPDGQDGC